MNLIHFANSKVPVFETLAYPYNLVPRAKIELAQDKVPRDFKALLAFSRNDIFLINVGHCLL